MMPVLHSPTTIRLYEVRSGASLWDAARELIERAKEGDGKCMALFNERALIAEPHTTEREVLAQFDAGMVRLFKDGR